MSLILEALRKSEAERRRGSAPDLYAELPPAPAPRTRAFPAWWWVLPGATLLALALWLALHAPPQPEFVAATPKADASAPQRPAEAEPPPAQPVQDVPTPAAPKATPPPAEVAVAAPTASQQAAGNARIVQAPPRAPAPDSAPAVVIAPAPTAPASPPVSAAAPAGRELGLRDLDPGTRTALPPLKLSMHLWNEDPARRFVILDGHRLGEGGRIGDAIVQRIERDGVVLDWQGQRIRLPVR